MRILVLAAALSVLAGCSGLPPEPVVPLRAGELAVGATLDVPLGGRPGGVSLWAGVGVGAGVDVAASLEAPFIPFQSLQRLANGAPFLPLAPPGLAVRRTFANGVGVGVGSASWVGVSEGTWPIQLTVGPFVTVGTWDADGLVARATGHLVYEAWTYRRDTTATMRRGLAAYGVVSAGRIAAADSGFAVPGMRVVVGRWLGRPGEASVALGAFVQGTDTRRPFRERP